MEPNSPDKSPIRKKSKSYHDRMLPEKALYAQALLSPTKKREGKFELYETILKSELLGVQELSESLVSPIKSPTRNKIFTYNTSPTKQTCETTSYQMSEFTQKLLSSPKKSLRRELPKTPFKVLDAPELQDDFYLNLVDWGNSNILAVGLGYLFNS